MPEPQRESDLHLHRAMTPEFSRERLLIDATCGDIPAKWFDSVISDAAAALKKDGAVNTIVGGPAGQYFLLRMPHGVHRLSVTGIPATAPAKDFAWAAPLWKLLEQGADTPDGRRTLAQSMTAKLPCGPCKVSWPEALKGLTEEHLATPGAFHRWVWSRRQEIAKSKGREVWEYPGFIGGGGGERPSSSESCAEE